MKEQISEQRLRLFNLVTLPRWLGKRLGNQLADHDEALKHPWVDFMRRTTIIAQTHNHQGAKEPLST